MFEEHFVFFSFETAENVIKFSFRANKMITNVEAYFEFCSSEMADKCLQIRIDRANFFTIVEVLLV